MTEAHSPLAEIERRVLERAKQETLDLADDAAASKLRTLWSLDHKHGLRPFDLASPELVVERAYRNLTSVRAARAAPGRRRRVGDHDQRARRHLRQAPPPVCPATTTRRSTTTSTSPHADQDPRRRLGAHRKLDPSEGLQDAQLDDGARLHIVHRDVGRGGHLIVNIRKFTGVAFRSLDELVDRGMLTPEVAEFLRAAVRARLSIVFAGPPGSGKTTLLSCCTAELDPTLRVVTAEEVFEVDVPLPNVASMQTRAARPDRPAVDLRGSSPGSCAWHPTSPSSARSATARRCRCC
jgi:pilus assembly protein CpaF